MNQIERIEKTTEVFKKGKIDKQTIIKILELIDEWANENVSSVTLLETPFMIFVLERRARMMRENIRNDENLMKLLSFLEHNTGFKNREITSMFNPFFKKGRPQNDK